MKKEERLEVGMVDAEPNALGMRVWLSDTSALNPNEEARSQLSILVNPSTHSTTSPLSCEFIFCLTRRIDLDFV